MVAQLIGPIAGVASEPVVGATWSALILFVGGALGAFARAGYSPTQNVRSQRTGLDMLIGGAFGLLLPAFATKLVPFIGLDILSLTALQQGSVAFFTGLAGSSMWTSLGWRLGYIITPQQAATGEAPDKPQVGVLRGTRDAKEVAKQYDDTHY